MKISCVRWSVNQLCFHKQNFLITNRFSDTNLQIYEEISKKLLAMSKISVDPDGMLIMYFFRRHFFNKESISRYKNNIFSRVKVKVCGQ